MNVQQQELQRQHDAAVAEVTTLRSRNVDTDTLNAAIARANDIKARLARAQADANLSAQIDRLTGGMAIRGARPGGLSLGAQVIHSELFKWLTDTKHTRAGQWNSPVTELMAATITGDPASGGALVVPDYQTGITPIPTRPLVVADLLAPGATTSNSITYMQETAFVNAAAAVAEGAAKPESTLTFAQVTDTASKIAHWVPATEEILEDVPQLMSYIDERLRLGVQLAEDDQLLNGNGTAPNFSGLLDRAGIAAPIVKAAGDNNADAVLRQMQAIATAQLVEPDGIIMHPTNFLTLLLLKDADGNYLAGGGPFTPAQRPTLWGKPVALTTAIAVNTALVGAFKYAAQFFRKGGIRVDVSNSHADFFIKNLVAIRAEERGILTVRRPAAYGLVTGLN